jgi:undecaprenyl-diphosphatase
MKPILNGEERAPAPVDGPSVELSRSQRLLKLLGSYYGISLGIAILTLVTFAWLADEVLEQEFAAMNRDVLLWIHGFAGPGLTSVAFAFTDLGSVLGVTILAICFGLVLIRMRHYWDAVTLLVVLTGGAVLVFVLKGVFQQIRPQVFTPYVAELNFSFPSGHSLISFAFWGYLASWLVHQDPKAPWRWLVGALCLAVAACVALSRLYLGVHWPTDVLAGLIVATFWVTACLSAQRWALARRSRRAPVVT